MEWTCIEHEVVFPDGKKCPECLNDKRALSKKTGLSAGSPLCKKCGRDAETPSKCKGNFGVDGFANQEHVYAWDGTPEGAKAIADSFDKQAAALRDRADFISRKSIKWERLYENLRETNQLTKNRASKLLDTRFSFLKEWVLDEPDIRNEAVVLLAGGVIEISSNVGYIQAKQAASKAIDEWKSH